ncbi:MAG: hypothetical protein ABIJ45_12465 [Candidatus Zixiibacteriota bacterium]
MTNNYDKTDLLLQYANNALTPGELKKVKKLIESDPEMAALYAAILTLRDEGKRTNWPSLKKSIKTLSSQMFDDFQKLKKTGNKINGVRVFDSKAMPLPEGIRPAVVDCRRVKFKIDKLHLELSMYPISVNAYELIGQLSGFESPGYLTFTLSGGKRKFSVEGDKFHIFRFAKVLQGNYTLNIHFDKKKIGAVGIDL